MGTFNQALDAFRNGAEYAGIGLAMLGDGITALDFDNCINEWGQIDAQVLALVAGTYGAVSPSGRGIRAFLRGTMPDRKYDAGKVTGIEVFSGKGFVTVTADVLTGSAQDIVDLSDERRDAINARLGHSEIQSKSDWLAPTAGNGPAVEANATGPGIDPRTVIDLRSALNTIPADAREDWVYIGQCLRPLGNVGRELWLTWSQLSELYQPADAARVWASFAAEAKYGIGGVFVKAKGLGWVAEDNWRERCYRAGITTGDQDAKRKAFTRAKQALGDAGLLGTWDGFFWPKLAA
ncbi:MAG: PriCT-2 domain-containing protein [Casimicrobiaceae bacterium]